MTDFGHTPYKNVNVGLTEPFVKPMVGFKAEQLVEVIKSLVEIVFAREDRPWPRSSRSTT